MKASGLWLSLLVAAAAPVSAQVTVEVTQDQDQFLPAEPVLTAVRITNRSGRDLHLGREPDWLTFSVQSREVEVVPKIGDPPVVGEFVLESSRVATKHVDLAPCFALTHSGRYSVTAIVRIKEWNLTIASQPRSFDIIDGARLWEQDVGLPLPEGQTNGTPEVRKFILQEANYLRGQLRLYVRLTDASGARTFTIYPIGPMVSFSRPEPQVDKFSNLHLLYQEGPHAFLYTVINPQGEIIARRTYDYVDKHPRLEPDADGKIMVVGGVRRAVPSDLPPDPASTPGEQPPKPMPAPGEIMVPAS